MSGSIPLPDGSAASVSTAFVSPPEEKLRLAWDYEWSSLRISVHADNHRLLVLP
jgi:hypothetical protein